MQEQKTSPSNRKIRIHPDEFPVAEHMFREAVGAYLRADDDFWILEDMAKDNLARIMSRIAKANKDEKISEAKLERLARSDSEWEQYKNGLHAARQERGEAKAQFVKADRYWQTLQSGLTYKRSEMEHKV